MRHAEKLALQHGRNKIAVIAGIGTRNYYRKLGYKLNSTGEGGFLIKRLYSWNEIAFYAMTIISLLVLLVAMYLKM